MIHFNEGDKSLYISESLEICMTGDFLPSDIITVREIGTNLPIMGFQAQYLSTGENV
jgi:hypothetical protein